MERCFKVQQSTVTVRVFLSFNQCCLMFRSPSKVHCKVVMKNYYLVLSSITKCITILHVGRRSVVAGVVLECVKKSSSVL